MRLPRAGFELRTPMLISDTVVGLLKPPIN